MLDLIHPRDYLGLPLDRPRWGTVPAGLPDTGRRRPLGVTLIAVLDFIGVAFTALGLVLLLTRALPDVPVGASTWIATAISGGALLVGGLGLWRLQRWGWWVELGHNVFAVLTQGWGVVADPLTPASLVGLAIPLLIIAYLTRPAIRARFTASALPAPPQAAPGA